MRFHFIKFQWRVSSWPFCINFPCRNVEVFSRQSFKRVQRFQFQGKWERGHEIFRERTPRSDVEKNQFRSYLLSLCFSLRSRNSELVKNTIQGTEKNVKNIKTKTLWNYRRDGKLLLNVSVFLPFCMRDYWGCQSGNTNENSVINTKLLLFLHFIFLFFASLQPVFCICILRHFIQQPSTGQSRKNCYDQKR